MATAESLQRLASGLLERMGRRWGMGEAEERPECSLDPPDGGLGGGGGQGVCLGEEQARSKATLREWESRDWE